MDRFVAFVEARREELARELFRREHGALRVGRGFGRFVDRAVVWWLFARMCEQRNVTPPRLAYWEDARDELPAEIFERLWDGYEAEAAEPLAAETLGYVYESFLGSRITLTTNGPRFGSSHLHRKSSGVFYTPQYIVDYMVDATVGKLIAGKSPQEMRKVRVLDPACGTGRFLLRVYDRVVEEHVRWFRAHGNQERVTYSTKCGILENCIFGIDIDGLAVEVAKLSLYLKVMGGEELSEKHSNSHEIRSGRSSEAKAPDFRRSRTARLYPALKRWATSGTPSETASVLGANFQCGDSLLAARGESFDVVLGNPPYGAKLTQAMRTTLAKRFDGGTTETAALMMLQASRNLTRHGGLNGFIVPKAFTYSSNWAKVRGELLEELTALVDAGRVWPEVRLEQVIYFLQKGAKGKSYANGRRKDERFEEVAQIEKQHCDDFGFLLSGITREELAVGLKIRSAGSFLGEYLENTRGAMFQKQVEKGCPGRRVIGGQQIQRYRIDGEKGFIESRASLDRNAFVVPGSILVQNIIAHIEKPVDQIKITAATVDEGMAEEIVILDTVNQLTNRSKLSSCFFLAILNSRLVNWYVYRFIYAKAIRTMHFDGPVTSRIPVPRITGENRGLYEEIVREAGSEAMEAAVYGLYGLTEEEIGIVERGMHR